MVNPYHQRMGNKFEGSIPNPYFYQMDKHLMNKVPIINTTQFMNFNNMSY